MSRTTRTLLALGLMAVGAVVALAMMAQRYGEVLDRRRGGARAGQPEGEVLPGSEADRLVGAYLAVLFRAGSAGGEDLDRVLANEGIDRETFQELDGIARAWAEGSSEVPVAYAEALDRRGSEVRDLLDEGYESRGP